MSEDQTSQASLSPCFDLGTVVACAIMLRTQWFSRGRRQPQCCCFRETRERQFLVLVVWCFFYFFFFLFSLDCVFTSGLTKLFQLLSFPHKGLESLGGCLSNWPSEVKLKEDEHYVPVQLAELCRIVWRSSVLDSVFPWRHLNGFGSNRAFILTELSMLWLLVGENCSLVGHLTCSKGKGGNKGSLYSKLLEGKASKHVPCLAGIELIFFW